MTVKEMIEELSKYDENIEVYIEMKTYFNPGDSSWVADIEFDAACNSVDIITKR